MTKSAFYLTRHAARMIQEIYAASQARWGERTATRYMAELYTVMKKIAAAPMLGKRRENRSTPFLMVPAGKHFIVYDCFKKGVIIITLLHQRRDIEKILAHTPTHFLAEIETIKKNA